MASNCELIGDFPPDDSSGKRGIESITGWSGPAAGAVLRVQSARAGAVLRVHHRSSFRPFVFADGSGVRGSMHGASIRARLGGRASTRFGVRARRECAMSLDVSSFKEDTG
jgi:hypothetical protein